MTPKKKKDGQLNLFTGKPNGARVSREESGKREIYISELDLNDLLPIEYQDKSTKNKH